MTIRSVMIGSGVAAWLALLVTSAALFERYMRTPGRVGVPASVVGAADADEGDGLWHVTMYAHPKCPCTRASLAELARVAEAVGAEADGRAHVVYEFVMYRPGSEGDEWVRGKSFDLVQGITGARVVIDPDGVMAARAGAMTSGHVVVRDGSGAVVYAGGMTNGRGMTGASAAGDALIAALRGEQIALSAGPVFGCEITGREAMAVQGEVP